jgi:membrane protease subunit (stomatin/prohibitin family)
MSIIDRIKFDASSDNWIVWKYNRDDIRLGAQLVVNESQEALFFKGGQALDTFGPGTHTLSTGNLPLISKLVNLPFGGETPFTAEVWYVNRTAKRDLRWGTRSSIPLIDPVYRFPVNVRAFGQWGFRVEDTRSLITQLVGTLPAFSSEKLDAYFAGEIIQKLSDILSNWFTAQGLSIFEANSKLNQISESTAVAIKAEFKRFGLEIVNFNVERISLPEEDMRKFQEVLGKRMEIDQLSKAQVGPGYTASRSFDVLEKAAGNESGAAGGVIAGAMGLGMGISAGVPLGQKVAEAVSSASSPGGGAEEPMAKLQKLKQMLDAGLINQQDFDAKKRQILDAL